MTQKVLVGQIAHAALTPIKHSPQALFSRETMDKEELNNNSYKAPNLAPL